MTTSSTIETTDPSLLLTASAWEYRWKFLILMASQPAYAVLVYFVFGGDGPWYAPAFSVAQAITGGALAFCGASLRICGTAELTVAVMSSEDPDAESLVTSGLFSAVRNPLYAGTILLFAGYAVLFHWVGAAAFLLFHFWRYDRVVRLEECGLSTRWNEEFRAYTQRAARWFPGPAGLLRIGMPRASMASVLSNAGFVGLAIGVITSAATANLLWVIPFEVIGFAIFAAYHLSRGRGRRSPAN